MAEASEIIARRIADAGPGLHPVSKLREAIYQTALIELRKVRQVFVLDDGGDREAEILEEQLEARAGGHYDR